MTALPGWPAVSGAATFQNIRRALAGQVVRDSAGTLRKGILPYTATALVTGTATMNVAVAAFVAVLDRNGAVFLANDGTVNVLLSSAPVSGSRWSVVYVKQRETEAPFSDGVAGPIIDKVESVTSAAAARALLPAGALELAIVQVNAGAANTNAVGVTITQTVPYTAMAGGTVWVRDSTELAAWTPADGAFAYEISSGRVYRRTGGAWLVNPVSQASGVVVCPATAGGGASPLFWSDLIDVTFPAGRFSSAPNVFVQTIGPAGQVSFGGLVEQITTSGCKVRGMRIGSVPTNVFSVEWYAIQP